MSGYLSATLFAAICVGTALLIVAGFLAIAIAITEGVSKLRRRFARH